VARQYDRSAADTVDTTGLGVDELARSLIAQHCAASPSTWTAQPTAGAAPLPTTVLYGATAVGKSTIGWELVRRRWAAGRATAYIDVEQLGFHGPDYDRDVHTTAYAALTRGYEYAGAEDLIVVTRDPELVADAHLDGVTPVLLDASPDALGTRIGLRSRDSTGRLPGDEILGADPARQRLLTARAHREAERFRRNGGPTVMVDTTDTDPTDVVDRIEREGARHG